MPEEIIPQISPESPKETDIDRLSGEILKHKENPEMRQVSGEELVRHALTSMAPAPAAPAPAADEDSMLPKYVKDATPAAKLEIEQLVSLAFKEGIAKAQSEALKSSPYILDAFHDALAGKLYPELKKRKLVD